MKTLFTNDTTISIDSFTFEVLSVEELSLLKGGKGSREQDSYADWF